MLGSLEAENRRAYTYQRDPLAVQRPRSWQYSESDSSPAEIAKKTIDYAESNAAYFEVLPAELPELMKIATGKEARPPELAFLLLEPPPISPLRRADASYRHYDREDIYPVRLHKADLLAAKAIPEIPCLRSDDDDCFRRAFYGQGPLFRMVMPKGRSGRTESPSTYHRRTRTGQLEATVLPAKLRTSGRTVPSA